MDSRLHIFVGVDLIVEVFFAFAGCVLNTIIHQGKVDAKVSCHPLRTHIIVFVALIFLQTTCFNAIDI
jgi:hypothetical protein